MAVDILGSGESDSEDGGAQLEKGTDFVINEEFATRFAYNKEREELSRLEDKLGHNSLKRKRGDQHDDPSADSNEGSTSESEDEDDAGELATEALDSEISATLAAIRSKDPRVYDKKSTFYTQTDEDGVDSKHSQTVPKKEKPVYLRDYHRQNLLYGINDVAYQDEHVPLTYNDEQEALKRSIVGEINAAAANDLASSSSDSDVGSGSYGKGFLVAKPRPKQKEKERASSRSKLDVENADKDPETFLSSFMASRAWVPSQRSHYQPFESDDEEEERKAEEFEEAYNLRFEDPSKSNQTLISHARDITAKYSVRREEKKPRRKVREAEQEKKEAAHHERAGEKARLRKLKINEAERKLRKIKKAAGLKSGADLSPEDWARFLDEDWDDANWEEEMQKRFGDSYYAQDDASSDEDKDGSSKKSRKPRKPKWKDDIEIRDLVPDYEEELPAVELSDHDQEETAEGTNDVGDGTYHSSKRRKKDRQGEKMDARKERKVIEQLVDDRLELDVALSGNQKKATGFRYRETSPLSFGLSVRDILMAEDSQLNDYAGLKKLAAFRDPSKKRKDQKHLGKKARLRQWRRDTFGNEEGPALLVEDALKAKEPKLEATARHGSQGDDADTEPPKKKRRRSKKSRVESTVEV